MSGTSPKRCSTFAELAARIRSTDLIPSQRPLLEQTDERLAKLADADITSVADIRRELKYKKSVPSVAARTGLDEDYLALLRRAVLGFFPQPEPLRVFDWIDPKNIAMLADVGIKNSEQLRAAWVEDSAALAERCGVSEATVVELGELSDLVQVQWISASLARALRAAGYHTPAAVAEADPPDLVQAVAEANMGRRFFNATIGERDIARIIDAASYVGERSN